MIVLIINGAPRVGKNTFIELLRKNTKEPIVAISSIDWIKRISTWMGWKGKKEAKDRQFLSDLKGLSSAYNDMPFKKITDPLSTYKDNPNIAPKYFCTNIREPKEIHKLVCWCIERDILCTTVWIRNKKAESKALDENFSSDGDTTFAEYTYDCILTNNGSKRDFEELIQRFKVAIES
jgi:hypothetical protein